MLAVPVWCAKMNQRAIAIDYGSRRTGIAIGDTESKMAAPFERFENLTDDQLLEKIAELVKREDISVIVCGLPLNENGSLGPQAMLTEKFAASLEKTIALPVVRVDERLTSHDAESRLAGHFTRKQKRKRVDAIAAARILQDFFDHLH